MSKLVIKNLHVSVKDKEILRGVNLTINSGDSLALLGPNGHGKSTLLASIMGNPNFTITEGSIFLDDIDVLSLPVDERSKAGIFLGMQYPAEIPGVNSADFYKVAINAHREKPMNLFEYYSSLQEAYKRVGIPFDMSERNLNEGFSGGEKKRNEILQMILLKPKFALLDEIDSGLDVDAMNLVANVINEEREKGMSFLTISHYARLFDMIKPNRAAVMINGQIVIDGDSSIVERIDAEGYEWIKDELGIEIEKISDEKKKISIGVCATKEALKK